MGLKIQDAEKLPTATRRSLVDVVVNKPQPLSRIDLLIKEPRFHDGKFFFLFS